MTRPYRALATLTVVAWTAACGATARLIGPSETEDVTIRFVMSGGIAGLQTNVVIDGALGIARIDCINVCSTNPRDLQLPLSATQIADLATRLESAGILDLDGTDFGTQCCDMFGIDLTYERGDRSSRVTGTDVLWPAELFPVLQRLAALARGVVPALVEMDSSPSEWPSDVLTVDGVELFQRTLFIDVTYGGGCALHPMDLVGWGGWMESAPVQVNVLLTHEDNDDACDALVSERRSFDLTAFFEAYEEAYGPIGSPRPSIVLRLSAPGSEEPIVVEIEL